MNTDTCTIEGCDKTVRARGYCPAHYERWRAGKPLTTPVRRKGPPGGLPCRIEGCDRKAVSDMLCTSHLYRQSAGKSLEEPLREYVKTDNLLARLRRYAPEGEPDACWEWTGGKIKGYGIITIEDSKHRGAHVVAWELANGQRLPYGMVILHECDNPPCTNPRHLRMGTHTENMADKVAKKRHAFGGRHGLAKLDEVKVLEIRALYATGNWGFRSLGKKFGVSATSIAKITKRESWTHI